MPDKRLHHQATRTSCFVYILIYQSINMHIRILSENYFACFSPESNTGTLDSQSSYMTTWPQQAMVVCTCQTPVQTITIYLHQQKILFLASLEHRTPGFWNACKADMATTTSKVMAMLNCHSIIISLYLHKNI